MQNISKEKQMSECGMIQVKRLEENEDGSANLEIETNQEATRYLVEIGLARLLEMALDKENDDYEIDNDLIKASEATTRK